MNVVDVVDGVDGVDGVQGRSRLLQDQNLTDDPGSESLGGGIDLDLTSISRPIPVTTPTLQDTAAVVQAVRESPLQLQARVEGKEVHVPLPRCV